MQKPGCLMILQAMSFLHPGTGQHSGIVDLPVQREVHTGFPLIQSSSLKGSLRDRAEQQHEKTTEDLTVVFGSNDAKKTAGALAVSDARLLAFPVRSLQQVFVWISCSLVVERLERDLRLIPQVGLAMAEKLKAALEPLRKLSFGEVWVPTTAAHFETPLVLEEQLLTLRKNEAAVDKVTEVFYELCPGLQTHRFALVSDEDFQYFVRHTTQVSARIRLNERKTTQGDGGNLWYEETLPPETVFYALLLANKSRVEGIERDAVKVLQWARDLFMEYHYLQIGGNETVGQGWCQVYYWPGGA